MLLHMHIGRYTYIAAALCAGAVLAGPSGATPRVQSVGVIASDAIREASGLARSLRRDARLWIVNDGGSPPVLHAVGYDATPQGSVHVAGVRNVDWEDLASFEHDGRQQLLIADIGDNAAQREFLSLHIVDEPDPTLERSIAVARSIHFRYPKGPRDAESVAVDAAEEKVYVLAKRTIPAELYMLPLTTGDAIVTARYLGTVDSLPQPSADEQANAAALFWRWQPTALDLAPDRSYAAVLTYRAAYTYRRGAGESWFEALSKPPRIVPLQGIYAESLAITARGIYLTVEGQNPPLYRFDCC